MKTKILAVAIFVIFLAIFSAPTAHAALTDAQIQAILGLLNSFGADQSVVDNVSLSLRGQPTSGSATGVFSYCPQLTYNLYLGIGDTETGGQVSQLQKFLAQDSSIYSEGQITGFFGPLTEQAVKKFQAKYGIVSSGSSETTGHGVVGSVTRAKIKEVCGAVPQTPAKFTKLAVPSNLLTAGTQAEKGLYRFSITAPVTAPVSTDFNSFVFNIDYSKSVSAKIHTYGLYAYLDSNFSTADTAFSPDSLINYGNCVNNISDVFGYNALASVEIKPDRGSVSCKNPTTYNIPAGVTRYFELRATVADVESGIGTETVGVLLAYPFSMATEYFTSPNGGSAVVPTAPSITVLSPNGGETWQIGSTQTIRWNSSGINKVSIWLCKLGICGRFGNIPATGISNVGSYTFTVDTNITPFGAYTPSPDLKIRVANEDDYPISTIYDDSNAPFSIVSPQVTRGACGSAQGVSSVTQPATNLCSAGSVYNQRSNSVNWLWDCAVKNQYDANDVIGCYAPKVQASTPATQPTITVLSPNGGEILTESSLGNGNVLLNSSRAGLQFSMFLVDSSNTSRHWRLNDGTTAGSGSNTVGVDLTRGAFIFANTLDELAQIQNERLQSVLSGSYLLRICETIFSYPTRQYRNCDTSDASFSIVAPTVYNPPAGSLSVSLDSASPALRDVVAGSTGVELARIKYTATSEDIYVRQVALQLSDPALNAPNDLVGQLVSLEDTSGHQVGTATFFTGDYAVSTNFGNAFLVPKDGSKTMIIKGDIAQITPYGPLLFAGDTLKVDYNGNNVGIDGGNYGYGSASGNIIVPTGSDTASAGVKIVQPITQQPAITVISPNGGEAWRVGEARAITWSSQNYSASSNVRIALAQDTSGGAMPPKQVLVIAQLTPNDGIETWVIPNTLASGSNYYIDITCGDIVPVCGGDFSVPFTVSSLPTQVLNCVDNDSGDPYTYGSVTLKNPDGSLRVLNDFCRDLTILNEYACTAAGEFLGDNYTCPNGCSNGACIKTSASSGSSSLNLANIMSAIEGLIKAFSE